MKIVMPVANHKATISRAGGKKKKDPKTTMHNESLIFVYRNTGSSSCTIKKFTTIVRP